MGSSRIVINQRGQKVTAGISNIAFYIDPEEMISVYMAITWTR